MVSRLRRLELLSWQVPTRLCTWSKAAGLAERIASSMRSGAMFSECNVFRSAQVLARGARLRARAGI
jgi:hypothetical protein